MGAGTEDTDASRNQRGVREDCKVIFCFYPQIREIQLDFSPSRKNEERRLEQKTNPKGQLTVNLNCTDWFDSYDYDDPDYVE